MSELRTGGANIASFIERSGDPGGIANQVRVYSKDVAGTSELFAQNNAGTVFPIAGPSMIDTLDKAYDGPTGSGAGRSITADAGAVAIVLSGAPVGNQALVLTETAVARTAAMMSLTRDVAVISPLAHVVAIDNNATTNNAIDIFQGGGGDAINITLDEASGGNGQGLVIDETSAARLRSMVELNRDAAVITPGAHVVTIDNDGAGACINLEQGGSGVALDILIDGAGFLGQALVLTETAVARTNTMMSITRDAAVVDAAAHAMGITNAGTLNNAINVSQDGGGDAVNVVLGDAALTGQALVVTEDDVVRTTAMASLVRQPLATGRVIDIDNNGAGNSINIAHAGNGDAIAIVLDGASVLSQAIVVSETAVARSQPMVTLQRNATASAAGAHVLDIQNDGGGNGIRMLQGGTADGLNMILDGSSTLNQGIVITENAVARTTAMMSLSRDAAASGIVLEITNAGSGLSLDIVSGIPRIQTAQALGGGAAPTLGTIGGSGPAAAAQNEWMQINTQNGARFLPVWA